MQFVLFFPAAVLGYFIIPYKQRNLWLLILSYFYYMCWRPEYALLLLASTCITFVSGFVIGRNPKNNTSSKIAVAISVILNLGLLAFFKYFDFGFDTLAAVCRQFGITIVHPDFDILLPVGISFYIFQALSYTMDVYRGEVKCE